MTRILIAEDEERISRFIEKGLRAAGYVPTVVADGVTAETGVAVKYLIGTMIEVPRAALIAAQIAAFAELI